MSEIAAYFDAECFAGRNGEIHSGFDDPAAWGNRGRFGHGAGAAALGRRHPSGARRAAALGCAQPRVSRQALGNLDRGARTRSHPSTRRTGGGGGHRPLGAGQRAGGFRHSRASGCHAGFPTPSGSGSRL